MCREEINIINSRSVCWNRVKKDQAQFKVMAEHDSTNENLDGYYPLLRNCECEGF